MQAGLIGAWERLRYRLTATPTASGVYNLSATLTSRHARSLSDFTEIARLEIAVSRDEQGQASTLFTAQWLSNTYTFTASNADGGSLRIEWVAPRWYLRAVGAEEEWYFTWQSVEVYRGNTLVATWAGGSYSVSLMGYRYKAPAAAPLLLVQMTAGATAGYVPAPNDNAYSDSSTARIDATGGWAVRVGNKWQAFPVSLQVASPLSPPCNLTLSQSPLMSAGDTDSASLTARASASYSQSAWSTAVCTECDTGTANPPFVYRWRDIITSGSQETASAWLIPDLPHALVRLIEPTASMIYRAKLPHCQTLRSTTGSHYRLECNNDLACWDTQSDAQTVYPFTDEFLGVLRDGTHALESPLEPQTHAPYTWQYEWSWSHTRPNQLIEPGACPLDPIGGGPGNVVICRCESPLLFQSESKSIQASVSFPAVATGQCLPYYDHEQAVARYFNTWGNRLWSYLLWFEDWALGTPLTSVPRTDYWLPLQQQWLYHNALPPSDATKQRNLCALEPLTVSPHRDWVETELLGVPTLWAGACRFDLLYTTSVAQKQLTSSSQPRWTLINATAVFGANIAVTPTQATSTLEFDLTDWQVEPYLYPALCSAVRVQVTGVYNSVRVYLVNFEGDAYELQPDPNDATKYRYTPAADSVYAGDWAQSYAAEVAGYSETGFDLRPEGRSSSVMADPARRTLWELLHSQTPAKLRIVVEQTAPTPYTLVYPTFYREFKESNNTKAYPLTAHTQAVVDHDALWRYGGLNFQLTTPVPQLRPVHQSPTVYDALCVRNLLYRGESYQHQMTADANAFYDSVEWTGAFADLRMDTRSLIRPLKAQNHPAVWILINAYREVPPLACLPRRKRDPDLAETGDWGQWQYLISPLRRYHVGLDQPIHLHRVEYDSSGNETNRQIVTTYLEAFRRAHVTYHELALDNNEVITRWDGQPLNSPRYLVHCKGDDWARATPFHGYSAVIAMSETQGEWLCIARSSAWRAARAYVQEGVIQMGYARDVTLQDWIDHTTALSGVQPSLCYLPAARTLALAVQVGGEVRIYTQTSEGGGLNMATTVAQGAHPTLIATSDGRIYCYYYRQGAIYGRQYDALWQAIGSEFTAISPADDAEIDAIETVTAQGKSQIALIYRDGGQIKVKTSLDGRQFS